MMLILNLNKRKLTYLSNILLLLSHLHHSPVDLRPSHSQCPQLFKNINFAFVS